MNQPKICAFALGHLNHQGNDSKISACFRCSATLGNYKTDLMSAVANSTAAKQHRQQLMRGEWPDGCRSCKDFEDQGASSSRTGGLSRYDTDALIRDYNWDTGEIKHVRSIELRFGNECNLTCRHCSPAFSSRWHALTKADHSVWKHALDREPEVIDYQMHPEYLQDILVNIVPHLSEIMFSGGETLYQKQHYKFLAQIPAEHAAHIKLFYVTNGTMTRMRHYDALEIWKKFEKVTVVISTDGVGDQFEYFRVGAKWQDVEKNIALFRSAGHWTEAVITCSAYQMFDLTDTIDYLYDNNIADEITSAAVQYPPMLNPRVIPHAVKEQLFAEWESYKTRLDPLKRMTVSFVGDHPMSHMMGDNSNIYDTDFAIPTWADFANSVRFTDRLFNTRIEDVFPKIAALLPPA